MEVGVPSLTGWLNDPVSIMNKIFEEYQAAEYSQSNIFYGDVVSFKHTTASYTTVDELIARIEVDLNRLYSNYFKKVTPMVEIIPSDGITTININVEVMYRGEKYTLDRAIKVRTDNIANVEKYDTELSKLYNYKTKV